MASATVGELFVKIGVKGSEQANRSLRETKGGLTNIAQEGWKAKIAIMAAIAAIEKMFSSSAKMGTSLMLTSTALGLDAKKLGDLQFAMSRAGMSASDTNAALSSLSKTFADIALNKIPPDMFIPLKELAGIDIADMTDPSKLPAVLDKLWKLSKTGNMPILTQFFQGAGINEQFVSALRLLEKPPSSYKDPFNFGKSAKDLMRIDVKLDDLQRRFNDISKNFTLKFGDKLLPAIERLAAVLDKLLTLVYKLDSLVGFFSKVSDFAGFITDALSQKVEAIPKSYEAAKAGNYGEAALIPLKAMLAGSPAEFWGKQLMSKVSPSVKSGGAGGIKQEVVVNTTVHGNPTPQQLKQIENSVKEGVKKGHSEVNRKTMATMPSRGVVR